LKDIDPRFASALFDERREIADAFVWRFAYAEAVFRTVDISPDRGSLTLDVADGDGPQVFEPLPVRRSPMQTGGDLQVDEMTLELPNVEILISDASGPERTCLFDLSLNRVFNNCELWVYQVNLRNLGVMTHSRWDVVGAPTISRSEVSLQLHSAFGRCVRRCPNTVIQAGCNNALYDAFCGLNRATYTVTSSAITGTRTTLTSALAQADNYFDLGQIEFTSGRNIGAVMTVGKHLNASGRLSWNIPVRHDVAPGDRFTVCAGCPKTWAKCAAFGPPGFEVDNSGHYRGFPNIPVPESIL